MSCLMQGASRCQRKHGLCFVFTVPLCQLSLCAGCSSDSDPKTNCIRIAKKSVNPSARPHPGTREAEIGGL